MDDVRVHIFLGKCVGQSQVIQKKGKCVNIGTGATVKTVIANIPILQKIARFISVEISAEVVNVESGTEKCVGTGMTKVATDKNSVPICIKKPSQNKGATTAIKQGTVTKVMEVEVKVKRANREKVVEKKVKETEETVKKVKESEETVKKVKETGETV